MNDSDDPFKKAPDLESLEKHIQLDRMDPLAATQAAESITAPKPLGPVKQFYRDVMDCLTEPRYFFEVRYPQVKLTYALTFGIIVSWIAAFLDWLTRLIRHETLFDGFLRMKEKLHSLPMWKNLPDDFWAQPTEKTSFFPPWLVELFGIILSPFQSLAGFCVSGVILFIGAYLLIPKNPEPNKDPVDVSHLIKLVAFTSAPHLIASILGFLPLNLGAFIGWIYGLGLIIIALSQRYKISGLRAGGVLVIPSFIGMFVVACFLGVLAVIGYGMFTAIFGGH
ncbi:MAG: hypothetical protein H7333_00045 [Bdellovibrionales bacterium]|nr:hypothetical protein [Oligoflexia bacterium]